MLGENTEFRRDLGADSLDMVELTMALEYALDIVISDEAAAECRTVGDALGLIERSVWESTAPEEPLKRIDGIPG
jgi:acyl carrier protein